MNFQVPQFIEIEDKVFGPLTFKQFVYIAGGLGLSFLLYAYLSQFLPRMIVFIPIAAIVAFSLALAFYKVNSRPFILVTESAFRYLLTKKLYIWKRHPSSAKAATDKSAEGKQEFNLPRLSGSKLKDLSWSLDIKENIK